VNKKRRSQKLKLFSWEKHRKELIKDPEFVKAWQELQPEFKIVEVIIRARIKKGVTQKKLAQRMKTKQSAISRLESGNANPSLNFLKRLASALGGTLKISFEGI